MKKKLFLLAIAGCVILFTVYSCSKNERGVGSTDQVVVEMSNDVNVQAYFTLVADQIKQVLVPYSKDLLKPDRVKPTKATFEAAAQNLVATHLDETKYLMELGLKIRKRYELANKSESEVRNLFDKVLDALNKNPKKHALSRRDPSDKASATRSVYSYANYHEPPETTTCVNYYLVTYYTDDPEHWLTATPLFESCTETSNPYQTGSVNYPFDTPDFEAAPVDPYDTSGILKKLKYCHDDLMTKVQRCD